MRQANSNIEVLHDPKSGNFVGVSLGYDYCAEHEWGIKTLKNKLNMFNEKEFNDFNDLKVPATSVVKLLVIKGWTILTTFIPWKDDPKEYDRYLSSYRSEPFISNWDSRDFFIATKDKKIAEFFKKIHDSFLNGNIVLSMSNSANPFGGNGICLTLFDKIPNETIVSFNKACDDHKDLLKLVAKTGIESKLEKADKKYYALSPMKDTKIKSKYQLKFWLNPMEQDRNNYGWFTVEQLEQWIEGKGPIPKGK